MGPFHTFPPRLQFTHCHLPAGPYPVSVLTHTRFHTPRICRFRARLHLSPPTCLVYLPPLTLPCYPHLYAPLPHAYPRCHLPAQDTTMPTTRTPTTVGHTTLPAPPALRFTYYIRTATAVLAFTAQHRLTAARTLLPTPRLRAARLRAAHACAAACHPALHQFHLLRTPRTCHHRHHAHYTTTPPWVLHYSIPHLLCRGAGQARITPFPLPGSRLTYCHSLLLPISFPHQFLVLPW